MTTLKGNGIDIHYRVDGAAPGKPWVTLSHSLACDLTMWDELAGALQNDYAVLRFDTRGHGASAAPDGAYAFEQLTADVVGLLDGLGIAQTHFIGLSMGGMIGQHLALAAPQRVAKLVIANSTSRIPPEAGPLWQQRIDLVREQGCAGVEQGTTARWLTPAFVAARPDAVARIGGQIRRTPPAGYIGCASAIRTLDITARLGTIRTPTLVIVGADDPGTPPAMSETIAQAIPGARLAVIPEASHLSNIEQPAAFYRLVTDFLKG